MGVFQLIEEGLVLIHEYKSAPMIIAVTASPGIPRVSIGINAPPIAALFAVSGAIIPSLAPLPKGTSGFLVVRFA